ncbi:SCP2 sterol-binding domain-containing protein [Woeseiaceae bacterium]|nr:SCP2 sterol-binding domain-containing protein [Woeseiaceae bacterium]MDB2544336.1 SCP2 sterol-binding domain-containing protein [Woeseiaceae bacterium]
MNILDKTLQPFINMVNRQIAEKTPALDLSKELEGKVISMKIRDTEHHLDFIMIENKLQAVNDSDDHDVQITGSLLTFTSLIKNSPEEAVRDGLLNFQGDIGIGQKFQELMRYAKPDFEEELSRVFGDMAAQNIGKVNSKVSHWVKDSKNILEQNISEYLQEEQKILPSQYEFNKFQVAVNKLRDDVDRIEIKFKKINHLD